MMAPMTQIAAERLRILVADDRADVLEALRLLLKGAGHRAETVDSPQAVLNAVESGPFDLILMDLNYARDTTSGQEGLELLAQLQEREDPAPVVVMTAWGNIDLAVEAMRRGACDFVQKPWDNARLLATVTNHARIGAEKRQAVLRARSELEIARSVQQKFFPQRTKTLRTLQCAGRCVPAREVGGDYYDFLDLAPGVLGFVVADVSGKGIAAALLMANLQGCFRSLCDSGPRSSPRWMLRAVNSLFYDCTPPEQYATLFFGQYDDATGRLAYVNCGHPPAVLAHAAGPLERLLPTATVIGAFRDWTCEERDIVLAPGDTLVVYSDGVTEAGIDTEREFGEARLLSMVQAGGAAGLEPLVDSIVDTAREASAGGHTDDITVLGVRRTTNLTAETPR